MKKKYKVLFHCTFLGENEELSRSQYRIEFFRKVLTVDRCFSQMKLGYVEGEVECGHFISNCHEFYDDQVMDLIELNELLEKIDSEKPWIE